MQIIGVCRAPLPPIYRKKDDFLSQVFSASWRSQCATNKGCLRLRLGIRANFLDILLVRNKMIYKLLVVLMVAKLSSSYTLPIKCEDLNIPHAEKSELCVLGYYVPRLSDAFPNMAFQDVQRRNAELSSALNFLYGNGENKFPLKRNPEISSALLSYLNTNGRNF